MAGVRSILESSVGYSENVTYAAIVDKNGIAVAHPYPTLEGQPMAEQEDLAPLVRAGTLAQLRAVYSDRTFEIRQPGCWPATRQFGSIRIGVSTLLVRSELRACALGARSARCSSRSSYRRSSPMLLSQWMLRPIHVIQSGLTRLGRGELDVRLDLPEQEFRDLGSSFDAVSQQLSAMGRGGADQDRPSSASRRTISSRSWTTSRTRWRCFRRAGK